jgi:hypothetical protein
VLYGNVVDAKEFLDKVALPILKNMPLFFGEFAACTYNALFYPTLFPADLYAY